MAYCEGMSDTNTHPANHWAALAFTRADRLTKALDFGGVSNQDMAETLGVSRQTIGNYTSGRTNPSKATLMAWALRTGVPLEWLQTGHIPDVPENEKMPLTPKSEGLKLPEMDSNHQPAG
ncbi:helix-turn-helix transcriptional regulator [Gulosibacter sediminis]|uniref:helix-turn-helix transcriptional regulator n=1 Tax=Gulosibacter sediminis TaxID=1729695 RepID=UPI003D15EAE8